MSCTLTISAPLLTANDITDKDVSKRSFGASLLKHKNDFLDMHWGCSK